MLLPKCHNYQQDIEVKNGIANIPIDALLTAEVITNETQLE